jgi:DNA-binding MarR family transcriptional regulator
MYLRNDFATDDKQLSLLTTISQAMSDRNCASVYIRGAALAKLAGIEPSELKPILIKLADRGIVNIRATGSGHCFYEVGK